MSDRRERYLPCPEHPDGGMRRHQTIAHGKNGEHQAVVIVVCDRCDKPLARKPKKSA